MPPSTRPRCATRLVPGWQICREYLVVLTRDPVFDRDFTPADALEVLSRLRSSLSMLFPSARALEELFELIQRYEVAGKHVHDANIVAAMSTKKISHLATYNRQDFAQFDEITLLSPPGGVGKEKPKNEANGD